MSDEQASTTETKPKAKRKPAKRKAKRKAVAGGSAERKEAGIHLLIIRAPVKLVKRLDARAKKAGTDRSKVVLGMLARA